MEIIDYRIVRSTISWSSGIKDEYLEDKVKEKIKDGWQPIGGVAMYGNTEEQAMVKYKKN